MQNSVLRFSYNKGTLNRVKEEQKDQEPDSKAEREKFKYR